MKEQQFNFVSLDLNGEKVSFYYGTLVHSLFSKELGIEITEMSQDNPDHLATFLWACAQSHRSLFGDGESYDKLKGYLWADIIAGMGKEAESFFNKLTQSPSGLSEEAVEGEDGGKK